jgi:hypothetical protein
MVPIMSHNKMAMGCRNQPWRPITSIVGTYNKKWLIVIRKLKKYRKKGQLLSSSNQGVLQNNQIQLQKL